jgi:3-oxoacyl-[acyl-carrier protein] reductase
MADIAFITGGSRGIGKSAALGLAEDGFDIWLNYRSSHHEAIEVQRQIQTMGRQCTLLPFDVTCKEAVHNTLAPLITDTAPSILINNAGYARDAIFGLMSDDEWSSVLDVHLNGFFHVTREILPYMLRRRKGRIINIASVSGLTGTPGQTNYSAAKAGLIGATKALAREVGKRGILVNAIAPGLIQTDMTKDLPTDDYLKMIPLNRMGSPEEVAGCIRFLCSPWSNYVTGQVLSVNGGLYI